MKFKIRISTFIIPFLLLLSCDEKPQPPVISTTEVSDITTSSVLTGGDISDDGGSTITARGICWDISDDPSVDDNYISEAGEADLFTSRITDLSPKTMYFVKAFAINSGGIGYGKTLSFTTLGDTPESVPGNASNITIKSATLNGTVNPHSLSTKVSFEWGINTNYGNIATNIQNPVTGNEAKSVTAIITDLTPCTTYHFRVKSENSLGVIYSNDMVFKTLGDIPEITTPGGSFITLNTAKISASVTANLFPTTVSIEWGTTISYGNTLNLQGSISGNEITSISSNLSGLIPQTTYHFRIIASNAMGTSRTGDMTFTTFAVSDIENNYYHSATIGNQTWITENLRSTKFNNGKAIPEITNQAEWESASFSYAYCWYNNDPAYKEIYGALYNLNVLEPSSNCRRNVCPAGWHVPTVSEWSELISFLKANGYSGVKPDDIAKSLAANNGWNSSSSPGSVGNDLTANNRTGFSALAGGTRTYESSQPFIQMGVKGSWWLIPDDFSQGYNYQCIEIVNDSSTVRQNGQIRIAGLSVRCVKDR
jgi:uncharacterized protein (TIGR02145 family)